MKENDGESLQIKVQEILMPNLSFYRESPEDKQLHLIDPVTALILSYEIMQFLATGFTIIQGVAWLRERKNKKNQVNNATINEKEQLPQIYKLKEIIKNKDVYSELLSEISGMLKYHGWPETDAETDAHKVIGVILQ